MASNGEMGSGGIGFCGALFLIFLVLKLVGVIDWSWWLVTLPLTIPFGVCLLLVLFVVVCLALVRK